MGQFLEQQDIYSSATIHHDYDNGNIVVVHWDQRKNQAYFLQRKVENAFANAGLFQLEHSGIDFDDRNLFRLFNSTANFFRSFLELISPAMFNGNFLKSSNLKGFIFEQPNRFCSGRIFPSVSANGGFCEHPLESSRNENLLHMVKNHKHQVFVVAGLQIAKLLGREFLSLPGGDKRVYPFFFECFYEAEKKEGNENNIVLGLA